MNTHINHAYSHFLNSEKRSGNLTDFASHLVNILRKKTSGLADPPQGPQSHRAVAGNEGTPSCRNRADQERRDLGKTPA